MEPYPGVSNYEMIDFLLTGRRLTRLDNCPDKMYVYLMLFNILNKYHVKFEQIWGSATMLAVGSFTETYHCFSLENYQVGMWRTRWWRYLTPLCVMFLRKYWTFALSVAKNSSLYISSGAVNSFHDNCVCVFVFNMYRLLKGINCAHFRWHQCSSRDCSDVIG